jgi:hypothetical protein
VLLLWFLWPFVVNGARFPLGPDAPVYLWWARLAGVDGLSAVERPGAPALTLVLEGTLGISAMQATVAIEVVLGVGVGLAAAALVRRSMNAWWSALAGLLAGTFAVHLSAGYVATLITAAAFLAAVTLLDDPRPRAAVVAALVLAGGGLAHPQFGLLCIAILLVAAATAWRSRDGAWRNIGGVALAGAAWMGTGLVAVRLGAPMLDVDTSKDAFLRRAGLTPELRSEYFDRFVHRWTRYVQWVSVPLAIAGFGTGRGNPGRILRAWFVLTFAGVALALVTGWLPADRFITFGFAVPILAAFGLLWLWRRLSDRRVVAIVLVAVMAFAMLAGSAIAWNRQEPFLSHDEVIAVSIANDAISTSVKPGTPLAFYVNNDSDMVSFLATRAGNVIRAGVPPDRIRDVVIVVPPSEGAQSWQRRALERLTAADLQTAEDHVGRSAKVFVLRPFDLTDSPSGAIVVDPPVKDFYPVDPLEEASGVGILWASIATLALLSVAGFGWARVGLVDPVRAAAVSPAVGAGVIIVVAIALDAFGASLGWTGGALAASALGGGGGYLVWLVLQRRTRMHPSPQVEQQPAE